MLVVWAALATALPTNGAALTDSASASATLTRRLPPFSVPGAPRSLVSLAVPVPSGVDLSRPVAYRVERSGFAEVLGRLEGQVGGVNPGITRGQILLTVRVPADARVGLLDVADVIFTDADGRVVLLPIVLRVPAVRAVRLMMPPAIADLQAGDRIELVFQLVNDGNAPERVAVEFDAPSGWPVRSSRTPVTTVAAFETIEVSLRLQVPVGVNGGEVSVPARIREVASLDSTVIASGFARLSIAAPEFRAPGLELVPFAAASTSALGSSFATGFRLQGPVADGVRMTLDVQPRPIGSPGSFSGLAAVGAFTQPIQLHLSGNRWSATAGNASGSVAALSGAFVNGDGVRGYLRLGTDGDIGVVAARPLLSSGRDGEMLSLQSTWRRGASRIAASVSHFQERNAGLVVRDLSAVAAEWSAPDFGAWDLMAGGALRRSVFGSGLGLNARARREYARGSLSAHVTFSPGGSESYANATLTAGADFTRQMTNRWVVDGSASQWADRSTAVGAMRSRSIALGNRYSVDARTTLSLRATSNRLDVESRGAIGGFGSEDFGLEGGVTRQLGGLNLSATSRVAFLERSTALFGGRESVIRVPQQHHALQVNTLLGSLGSVGFGGGRTLTDQGAGIPAAMDNVFASFTGNPRPLGVHRLSLNARAAYMGASGQGGGLITTLGAAFRSVGGWELLSSVERNELLRTPTGRANLFFSLRVSATAEVLVPRALLKVAGVVFNDVNDNGLRDAGESGVAGVVLRVDGVRVVSEADGTYRVPANIRGEVRLDPMGLPHGYVQRAASASARRERGDIALRQTGSLTLEINLVADRDGVRPQVDVSKVDVWLTDASGMEWVGRSDVSGEVIFDNIPAGRYSFRFDFSRVGEPLRGEDGALVEVAPNTSRHVTVTLRTRAVRLIEPPGRGGTGRGGRGGGATRGAHQ